jgi:transposase InsO family protein
MSQEELGRLALIQGAIDGKYTAGYTAKRLGISERHVKRLKRAVREQGAGAVVHGNSGRHPVNYKDDEVRRRIIGLKQSGAYAETNFTYFRELLMERENIQIGYTTLCGILKGAGIVSKKQHRTAGKQFRRRKRRSAFGELLQADATPFDWFGAGTRQALHGFIDDATGRLVGLYMCHNECLQGYLEALRQTLWKHGVPLEVYTDKAGLFFVNNKKPEHWTIDEQLAGKTLDKTQFGAIADELGINLIAAHSPQAKGRVERLWGTLQDRLPTYFKLNGITGREQFNAAAPQVMDWFNRRFAVEPESAETSFVPLTEKNNLDTLLAVKYERTTDACGCFSFHNLLFEVASEKTFCKKKIVFMFSERLGFRALYDKTYYPVKPLDFLNGSQTLPEVTKALLFTFFLADGKSVPQPQAGRG